MNKIATLAKIANRLDSLGLTREADVLDAFIRKVATATAPTAAGTNATPLEQEIPLLNYIATEAAEQIISRFSDILEAHPDIITNTETAKSILADEMEKVRNDRYSDKRNLGINIGNVNGDVPKFIPYLQDELKKAVKQKATATGWESYISKTKGGQAVKDSWVAYATAASAQTDFYSFVTWWKANSKSKNINSPQQTVTYLNSMTKGIMERKETRQIEGLRGVSREKAAEQLADQRWGQSVTEAVSSVPRDAAAGFKAAYDEV